MPRSPYQESRNLNHYAFFSHSCLPPFRMSDELLFPGSSSARRESGGRGGGGWGDRVDDWLASCSSARRESDGGDWGNRLDAWLAEGFQKATPSKRTSFILAVASALVRGQCTLVSSAIPCSHSPASHTAVALKENQEMLSRGCATWVGKFLEKFLGQASDR